MLVPLSDLLTNIVDQKKRGVEDSLKYLILNVHETNIANFLRFLGYWDAYGYSKFTRFSSSVRVELISRKGRGKQLEYYVQVIYDNEKVRLPWCSAGWLCTVEEFIGYF